MCHLKPFPRLMRVKNLTIDYLFFKLDYCLHFCRVTSDYCRSFNYTWISFIHTKKKKKHVDQGWYNCLNFEAQLKPWASTTRIKDGAYFPYSLANCLIDWRFEAMINQNPDDGFFYAVMMLYPICHNQVVKLVPWLVLKIEHLASYMNYQSQHMSGLHDRTTGVKFMYASHMFVFNIHLHYPLKERLSNTNDQMQWIIYNYTYFHLLSLSGSYI